MIGIRSGMELGPGCGCMVVPSSSANPPSCSELSAWPVGLNNTLMNANSHVLDSHCKVMSKAYSSPAEL